MLYPIMPIYLKSIGFSIFIIGLLEGVAEATAGLSKGYFGKLSDATSKRIPFIQVGYILSALSKPLTVIFSFPIWIFFVRTLDRLGKGIRTGARDALLSDEATPKTKGKIFGFHRSMDTLGAAIGPILALVFLYFYPNNYKLLFLLAVIPGIAAIIATIFLKEKKKEIPITNVKVSFFSFINYWKDSPEKYKKVVIGLLFFTLFNSSDVFLLLKIKESGLNDTNVISVYIFYNLVYALSAFPMGILADKLGLKNTFLLGLFLFIIVYLGFSVNNNIYIFGILFLLYGLYAAATEGIAKAWISNISAKEDTATAIGTFSGFQSICTMFASAFAGFVWYQFDATSTFIISAIATIIVLFYFLFFVKEEKLI
jgi:MFS family permease